MGTAEAEAVTYLLKQAELERFADRAALPEAETAQLSPSLSRHFYRPLPEVADYDGLLTNRSVANYQAEVVR